MNHIIISINQKVNALKQIYTITYGSLSHLLPTKGVLNWIGFDISWTFDGVAFTGGDGASGSSVCVTIGCLIPSNWLGSKSKLNLRTGGLLPVVLLYK